MEKVQDDIASSLDLKFLPEDTSSKRASRLSERLSQGKKVLIVLDDLWERLDLADIGIPFKNNDNCCKVVFTTRNRAVCNKMEADLDVEVELLSEKDSWTLFCKKVVVVGSNISTIIAKEIVNECRRLPLAIVTLALALRKNKNEAIWEDTLVQLKKSRYEGMEPVISSLQLSFNFLPNESTKMCLLLCCLFPEDYKIPTDVLLRYMWGENLFEDVDTVREARGRLLSLLHELTSSNLLLESNGNSGWRYDSYGSWRNDMYGREDSFFVMHDVVRDAAIQIASKDNKLGFKVKAGVGLIQWPDVKWTDCKRMSVMDNNIRCNLPSHVKASHLLTLSLRDNGHLEEIPSDFFSEMGGLQTLDLSWTGITSVPASVSCLVNLRTLLIDGCRLKSISPIQELETLEILSFRNAAVSKWPEDICKIRKLKLLDLTGSKWDLKIPLNVIASMHLLEELMMVMIEYDKTTGTKGCPELESLGNMTRLELRLRNCGCLYKDIPNWENLTRFRLSFVNGYNSFVTNSDKFHRSMILEFPLNSVANWVLVLMAKTEFLQLCDCQGIDSVKELDGKGFTVLKILYIKRCKGMKCLMDVNVTKMAPNYAFNSLEELMISQLSSFEAFYRGPIPGGFFSKLKILNVDSCHKLISLVPAELLVRLQNLESLTISFCDALKEVMQFEEGNEGEISWNKLSGSFSYFPPSPIFPNLQILEIKSCVELEYIFPLRVFQDLLQLTELSIKWCTKLKMIFGSDITEGSCSVVIDKLILPKLKKLELWRLYELSALSLPGLMLACPSLEELSVFECLHLKKLPFDTKCVPKLKRLKATRGWFDSLEWDDEDTKSLLLKTLVK